ncbi:SGNH/GDSL hydrolase family protein [Cysteiniphilum sp. QT6929]|uniref:SGNH/GDSL hydrolase family protein n=1 Tax=Cysteiniphilum sp. QT6929 TaxID=2975055 RepID=UPI0024B3AD86|nr:SGNH/GDSL hydrolase family protein [Cysteiniphilum sp. QT6929]WHN66517.1 SGNH/GDSL hydrolase family protein [Cysteiniphilum sp. QT6929]
MMKMNFSQYKKEWKKISLLTAAMLLSACDGGGGGDSAGVAVNVSSPTDNVIHADINQNNQKEFTVSVGDQSIGAVGQSNAYQVSVTQSNPNAGFTVDLGTCAQTISNGQSCQFSLSYAPTSDAQYNQQDTLTISVGGTIQTITVKGDQGQDFIVFGDSLSDAGVQDQLAALVNGLSTLSQGAFPAWPTVSGTSNEKSATYTTPGGNVWVTDLAKLVGASDSVALPNNNHYMQPIKVAYAKWYDQVNPLLQFFKISLDTESKKLTGNNYAQGGATTTCAGIGLVLPQSTFSSLKETPYYPPGNVPLYIPSPIGPIPQVNGQPAYSCPKASDADLQPVYDQLENYNQIDSYLQTMPFNGPTGQYQADPDKIYILWGGANNLFLEVAKQPTPSAAEVAQVMTQAAGDIAYDVQYLAAHGAKKFVVLFLPNIGLTPLAIAANQQSALEKASVAYNTALSNMLGALQKQDSSIKIVPVDVFNLMNDMVANYEMSALGKTYQFDDVTTPACIQASETGNPLAALTNSALLCTPQADNKKHLFEDTVHPTAETHQVIAAKIAKAMEAFN